MIQSTRFIALALTAGLVASATSAQNELGGFDSAKLVELKTVRKQPQAFKNVWVKFKATYFGLGAVHNPFFTRFTRASYVNFAMWSDDQAIWKQSEYDNPCSTLFCEKKDNTLLETIYSLQRYQRVLVTGVVRNAWQGEPWFEITEVEPTSDTRMTTASLSHLHRAWSLIEQRKWQQAAIELNLASSDSLTENARGWLHGYMGLCQMRMGRAAKASAQLQIAKGLVPESQIIDGWLEQVAKDPRSAIDTASRVTAIRRGDRPMWEAVEESQTKNKDSMKRGGLRNSKDSTDRMPGATPTGSTGTKPGTTGTKTTPTKSTTKTTSGSTPGTATTEPKTTTTQKTTSTKTSTKK